MRGFLGGLTSSSESAVRSMGGFFLGCVCVTLTGGGCSAGRGDGARGTRAGADGRGDGARGTDACAGAVGSGGGDG